jgi:hypothetical protein
LKEHEETRTDRLEEVRGEILKEGLRKPIVVDSGTKMIIDGHHRAKIFRDLGLERIPALCIDYLDEKIVLESHKNITKKYVLATVKKGSKFHPKTTYHMFRSGRNLVHVSEIAGNINFPIKDVR